MLVRATSTSNDATSVQGETGTGDSTQSLLRNSAYLALRQVQCEFHDGTAVLHGRLPSYFLKQMAQTVVAQSAAVNTVINEIEVTPPPLPDARANAHWETNRGVE
jgi:hypothetical protein